MKLDYTITDPRERAAFVEKILAETPNPTEAYLDILSDYICFALDKEDKKSKKILTPNRRETIEGHETSYEGLADKFENGEDGIHSLINTDNKYDYYVRRDRHITQNDIDTIPGMKEQMENIKFWKEQLVNAQGKAKYIIKRTIKEEESYKFYLKEECLKPISFKNITKQNHTPSFELSYGITDDLRVDYEGHFCLANPRLCAALLKDYSKFKHAAWGPAEGDLYYLMEAFDNLLDKALVDYPIYKQIAISKIDGLQNAEIQEVLQDKFGTTHSIEHISTIWARKIPELIASVAEDEILDYHFLNIEKGLYKTCSQCGQVKLRNNKNFSKNQTSKDGFYSICKSCRNQRDKLRRKKDEK